MEEISKNLKIYIRLLKKSEEDNEYKEQEKILETLEKLYYVLDDDEIAYLHSQGYC